MSTNDTPLTTIQEEPQMTINVRTIMGNFLNSREKKGWAVWWLLEQQGNTFFW